MSTVINGKYTAQTPNWPSVPVGQPVKGYAVVPNTLNTTITISSLAFTGSFPGDYSIPGGELPIVLNPNQSAIIEIDFTPSGAGPRTAGAVFTTSNPGYSPTLFLGGTAAATQLGMPFPSTMSFPDTKVGLTSTFTQYRIVNLWNAAITVTALGLTTGTDFAIIGAPIVPFGIPQGGQSPVFSVQFAPTVAGGRVDTINATVAGNVGSNTLVGTGTVLQSAFVLTGATSGTLFGFPGAPAAGTAGQPIILQSSPTDFNTEEPGSFVRMSDLGVVRLEKEILRVGGHYEDLGPATMTVTVKTRRVGKPDQVTSKDVILGTSGFADGWLREFLADLNNTGEILQLTISRGTNAGPVSIIDYIPEFDLKGEVIGGV